MKHDLPFSLWGWCAVILVASFMPWATSLVNFPLFGGISAIATGWTGNIKVFDIIIPNWIAVAFAVALAVIGWLQANSTDIHPQGEFSDRALWLNSHLPLLLFRF